MLTGARSRSTWCRRATATASSARSRPPRWIRKTIRAKAQASSLTKAVADQKPVYAVVTNCTYDGLCYNAVRVEELLDEVLRPHPLRRGLVRLRALQPDVPRPLRDARRPGGRTRGPRSSPPTPPTSCWRRCRRPPTSTSATASGAIDHHRFNKSYMMHTTTSPLYAIIASNDITAAMMDGSGGRSLTQEVIEEAVDFRQAVGRMWRSSPTRRTGSSSPGTPRR